MHRKTYLCIHGHFYQPPRENAWTDEIEVQPSASPYHDWNERIYHECYVQNARARILNQKGEIERTVNNFEKMSFNIGPTLFSWLERKHPDLYHQILHADQISSQRRNGHGNAIAQVYNHMIMPLASRLDQVTQVKWGIYDFQRRFGREPEGMWLPETACNDETIEILIEAGIKFTILSPLQAESVRTDSHDWHDVSGGSINPKVPYKYVLKKNPKKFLTLFFYDAGVARDVAFGSLAFEAKLFADRLEQSAGKGKVHHPELVHVATDGETFGHHKGFGERALAYLMEVEAQRRGFHLVNYGEFLEMYPATHEVRLRDALGYGTSWSCSHGVKRWYTHCGCRGGGPVEWKQYWRKPLRESLNWLRDELLGIYEKMAKSYFRDIWEARNDYIQIILEPSQEQKWLFFEKHAARYLSEEEVAKSLKLLDMQKFSMLMYTSCGWFFTELSGIETVQIIQYAARAIELAGQISGKPLEEAFLKRLESAKSNVADFKNGRGVYQNLVKPAADRRGNVYCEGI